MNTPKSPEGYTTYEEYSFPDWARFLSMAILVGFAALFIIVNNITIYPKSSAELIVASGLAIAGTLFIHESLHYLANTALGYEPIYLWPNAVYVPEEFLSVKQITVVLLAPQLLTIIYVVLLLSGTVEIYETIIGWGLMMNLGGASSDVAWVIRRVTWPDGTRVVVGEDHMNYVSFPEPTE